MTQINFILVGKKSIDLFNNIHSSDKDKIKLIHAIGMDHLTLETIDKNTLSIWLHPKSILSLNSAKNTVILLCPADEKELKLLSDKIPSWKPSPDTRFCIIADKSLENIKLKTGNIEFYSYPEHGVINEYIEEIYSKFFKKPVATPPTLERKPSMFDKIKKMPSLSRIFSSDAKGLVSESKIKLTP
ncbi:MAG: hypothetical protein ACYCQI_01195 [Gammaproteobacteria bacterium]